MSMSGRSNNIVPAVVDVAPIVNELIEIVVPVATDPERAALRARFKAVLKR